MPNLRHHPLSRLPALALAVGLIAAACGGEGDPAPLSTNISRSAAVLVDEGLVQLEAGALDEALATFDATIAALGDSEESLVPARALVGRGQTLALMDREDEAAASFEAALAEIGLATDPASGALAVDTVGHRLRLTGDAGEWIVGYKGYRDVLDHYEGFDHPDVIAANVRLLDEYALSLELLARHEEALVVYESIDERYGELTDPQLQLPLAVTFARSAANLRVLERDEEALFFFQRAIEVADDTSDDDLALLGSETWLDMAQLLTVLGARVEALEAFDSQFDRYGDRPEIAHRQLVLRGILQSGLLLQNLGRVEEARAAFEEILRQVEVPSSDATLAALAGVAEHQLGIVARG